MTAQQNTAPPSCRACGHVVLVTLTRGQAVERYDRCEHPSVRAGRLALEKSK